MISGRRFRLISGVLAIIVVSGLAVFADLHRTQKVKPQQHAVERAPVHHFQGEPNLTATSGTAPYATTGFQTIQFVDAKVGWADLRGGGIARTVDGGLSWRDVTPRMSDKVFLGATFDVHRAIVVASSGTTPATDHLYRTTDDGRHWSGPSPTIPSEHLFAHFGSQMLWHLAQQSVMQQASGQLSESRDGGGHWMLLKNTDRSGVGPAEVIGCPTRDLSFVSPTTGWAGGSCVNFNADLERTTDGGRTWSKQALPPQPAAVNVSPDEWIAIPAVRFSNPRDGLVVLDYAGSGTVFDRTRDGGKTWTSTVAPRSLNFAILDVVDPDTAFIGWDTSLSVTHDAGLTWTTIGAGIQLTAASGGVTLDFVSPEVGWLTTADGGVVSTKDGGRTWTRLPLPKWVGSR
jgi:photosystem II stability/assembly factor-like uncharacterized protein